MPKPDLSRIPTLYHGYVRLVEEDAVIDALSNSTEKTLSYLQAIPEEKWDYRYADGKWSIKEMVQHMIDTERIFSYRALCFARCEKASLPGFDENTYAAASEAERRSKNELLEELTAVRRSIEILFQSFSSEQLQYTGVANGNPVSVNGIGFITAGHALHHLKVLRERYLS